MYYYYTAPAKATRSKKPILDGKMILSKKTGREVMTKKLCAYLVLFVIFRRVSFFQSIIGPKYKKVRSIEGKKSTNKETRKQTNTAMLVLADS